ncbi:MAG: hypothetical protein DRQ88_09080 [Epsilonproteobacteria bacterium]|nr:MAG: hypothetical protein DRQ89_09840 [Campylobacterota bacterium]RLA65530.1 MAG: hypothetical protein DRQ88_09080 [Campylobacterota bacterium]
MTNVISISEFKQDEEKSLKNYLNILSFNELIIESTQTLKTIKNESSDPSLISKAIYLLEELNKRIDCSSRKYGDSLSHISEKVKTKIKELNKNA